MNYAIQSPLIDLKIKQTHSNFSPQIIGNYSIESTLGEGSFGKVKLATHIPSKEKVAIKILNKNKINDKEELSIVEKEIKFLKQLSHINIITIYEVLETPSHFYLVMEYINGGDLFAYIINHTHLTEEEASYFFCQLIHGIKAMHEKKISHRDIKPENILLTDRKILKIIDFGLSSEYDQYLSTTCGSANYSLPEMIRGIKYTGLNADLWASGIILYAMMCGYLPFDDNNNERIFAKILEGKVDFPREKESKVIISSQCKDLIIRMLAPNANKRISLDEILLHSFLFAGNKQYNQLLKNENTFMQNNIILEHMTTNLNFKRGEVLSSLDNNKHNNITTTFKLLKQRHIEGRFNNHNEENDNNQRDSIDLQLHKKTISNNLMNKIKKRASTSSDTPHGNLFKGSITSNNSILEDLDKILMENSGIDQSNIIPLYHPKISIAIKPVNDNNPLFNRLIRAKEAKLLNKKIDTSVSAEQVKRGGNTNVNTKSINESISTKSDSYKQLNNKNKLPHRNRYQRNKLPMTDQLENIYLTSINKKHVNKAINNMTIPSHTNSFRKSQLMTYHQNTISDFYSNPIKLSKEKKNPMAKIPKRKVNTLVLSIYQASIIQTKSQSKNHTQNKNNPSSSILKRDTPRTSHHSPLKSILLNHQIGKKSKSPTQKKALLSEVELNKMIPSQPNSITKNKNQNKKKHRDSCNNSNNHLLIIPKPKSANFALCTSKLSKSIIEKKLKEYCENNQYKINLELPSSSSSLAISSTSMSISSMIGNLNNNSHQSRYIIAVNLKDKLIVEISIIDNLTMLKLYHFIGNESITKDIIKKLIINVGF